MKMKKIVNEWRSYLIEGKAEKTPLEKKIEEIFTRDNLKYDRYLADVKAAAHAIEFLRGQELGNQESYLNRVEFGMSNADRIIRLLSNGQLFSQYFDVYKAEQPPKDKRFPETSERTFKAVEMTDTWSMNNLDRKLNPSARSSAANIDDAYKDLFAKIVQLEDLLKNGVYEFTKYFGKLSQWRTRDDRHTGGAAPTGLIVTPEEATDAEKEKIAEKFIFYMNHKDSPAFPMAAKAEEELQKALTMALNLWKTYPFKDGEEKQAFAGAVQRMEGALRQSQMDLSRILKNPQEYSKHNIPQKEPEVKEMDPFEIGMASSDPNEIWPQVRKLKRAKDPRVAQLQAHYNAMKAQGGA